MSTNSQKLGVPLGVCKYYRTSAPSAEILHRPSGGVLRAQLTVGLSLPEGDWILVLISNRECRDTEEVEGGGMDGKTPSVC